MTIKATYCFAAFGLALPLILVGRQDDPEHENVQHLKTAGLSAVMYASDYDDLFPYAQSTGGVIEVVRPYVKEVDTWWPVDHGRFLFSLALAGVDAKSIDKPAETVMIHSDTLAPDGRRDVCFADGHVARLTKDEWDDAKKTLELKIKKVGKPLPATLGKKYEALRPPKEIKNEF